MWRSDCRSSSVEASAKKRSVLLGLDAEPSGTPLEVGADRHFGPRVAPSGSDQSLAFLHGQAEQKLCQAPAGTYPDMRV